MTVLVSAALIYAIHEEMTSIQDRKPVILMVPVNLRKIFPSDSMLNFFGYIEPGYQFGKGKDQFEDVLNAVKEYFNESLTKEQIAGRMNELIAFEKHKILKWAPLELKNPCIRMGAKMAEREVTAVCSNMSVVKMPEEYMPYIKRFGVFTSTPRTEVCICSFGDVVSFGFTSRYDSSNIQRNFYRLLESLGVHITDPKAEYPEEVKPNYEGRKFFSRFSFICIAIVVIAVMADMIAAPEWLWSTFVGAGVLSMWLALMIGYTKRHNLLKNAMWQLLVVTLGCIVWDIFVGWRGWSVNIILPCACMLIEVSMLVISKIQSHSPREYMIYYVMAAGYSIVLPTLLRLLGIITMRVPTVLCVGCSFLFLLALIVFRGREFKEEMHKKFHV